MLYQNCRRRFSKAIEFPVITACPLYNWEYDLVNNVNYESIEEIPIANLGKQFLNLEMFDEFGNS